MQTVVNKIYFPNIQGKQIDIISDKQNLVTISIIHVSKKEYKNIIGTISDISTIKKKVPVESVIGYQILSPQRSILDFKNNQLILEKD